VGDFGEEDIDAEDGGVDILHCLGLLRVEVCGIHLAVVQPRSADGIERVNGRMLL